MATKQQIKQMIDEDRALLALDNKHLIAEMEKPHQFRDGGKIKELSRLINEHKRHIAQLKDALERATE